MTIKEVAQLAGVSPAAVSRFMNGGPLSAEKRRRIQYAIQKTGYRPNLTARTMRTGIVRQVGIIAPKINSDSVSQITAGITDRLHRDGYMPVLGCTGSSTDMEIQYLQNMEMARVAGIIFMARMLTPELEETLDKLEVPVVVTGQNYPGFTCVCHDDRNAMRELARLMLRKGRNRLLYIGAQEEDTAAGLARRQGADEAVEEAHSAGIQVEIRYCVADFNAESARTQMDRTLQDGYEPDGVLCATDAMALGAMAALRTRGYSIPEDVSVAGIGDSWAGVVAQPPLTTARMEFRRCGEIAAELLLSRIEEEKEHHEEQVCLDFSIIERESL